MRAIDTNVIVRYLVADDPDQAKRARTLIDHQDVFVCTTVILETEWVLRSVYGFPATQCTQALTDVAGLLQVTLEEAIAVAQALRWVTQGMDFADGLHLAKAQGCEAFVSFDVAFTKAASTHSIVKVRAA
jgi:predicted nucleic-acid-binding protein